MLAAAQPSQLCCMHRIKACQQERRSFCWRCALRLHAQPLSRVWHCAPPCHAAQEWEYLLEELALWFLLYSEGANLRHVPETMWFLYWCMRNSHEKQNQITVPPPTDQRSAAFIGEAVAISHVAAALQPPV